MFEIILSLLLTAAGTRWIDFLYKMPTAPLSFPAEIQSRSRFRKPIIFIILLASLLRFANEPLLIYLVAANFFLALIICTDFEQYVIFNKVLVPFAIIGGVMVIQLEISIVERIATALTGGGIFLLISKVTGGGIGGGDIKLIAVLGLWLSAESLLNVVVIACVAGGIVAAILILTKKKDRKSYFAYGPYFAAATIYTLFRGNFG